jgi:serine/threonine protein kinase
MSGDAERVSWDRHADPVWNLAMASQIDYATVRHLCGELLDLSHAEREASLGELSRTHPDLHKEIASILTACEWSAQADFLEPPTGPSADDAGDSRDDGPSPSVPGYEIKRELGRGASGTVYLARSHDPIERDVAIKVLGPHANTAGRDRFIAERRTLATFNHPNIAQIYDAGILAEDRPWVAIEYVEGRSITRFARERSLDWRSRVELLIQVCDAVQEVHRKGMVHGDLKPSNILISEATTTPTVKLVDFGSVMIVEDQKEDGAIRIETTLGYAAPERLTAAAPNPESDIFSLGVLLFEVIVGHHPLDDLPPQARLRSLASGEIPTAALRRPLLAAGELRSVIQRCCEPAPLSRYRSAGEVGDELRRVLSARPVLAHRRAPIRAALCTLRRRPLIISLIAVAAILTTMALAREWNARTALLDASDRERATLSLLVDNMLSSLEHQSGRAELREMLATTVLENLALIPEADLDASLIHHRIKALQNLGSITLSRNDHLTSRAIRLEALDLIEGLLAEDPTAPDLLRLHRTTRILVGDTHWRERDLETALSWYVPVHEDLEEAHVRNPDDTSIALSLGWSHRRLGSILSPTRPVEADAHIATGLEIADALVKRDPRDPRHLHLLGSLRLREGHLGSTALERLESFRKAVVAATMADRLDPNRWAQLTLLLDARIEIGMEMTNLDQRDAIQFARDTVALAERFRNENPDDRTSGHTLSRAKDVLAAAVARFEHSDRSE